MNIRIEQLDYDDLAPGETEDVPNNGAGKEYANYIRVTIGEKVQVFSDAMEPEDATFSRDLDWIVPLLRSVERAAKIERRMRNESNDKAE